MKEIKSVRIRKSNVKEASLDLRLVLFDKAFGARSVKGVDANIKGFDAKDMRSISPEIEYKGSRYKDLEDDKIIEEYIKWYNKFTSAESGKEVSFQIVQDPWLVDPPLFRSFGFDPYYLNNGCEVIISWFESDKVTVAGGIKWSNESGMEMDAIKGSSFSMVTVPGGMSFPKYDTSFKDSLLKSIECFNPKTGERLMFSDQTIKKWGLDNKDYYFPGSVKDKDIISKFLEVWRTMVPSEVDLCPDTTVSKNPKCELIEYKSPIELPIEKTAEQLNNESRGNLSSNKIKLNIKLPEEFIVNAREDVPKFSIWIGEPQVESIGEFDFGAGELLSIGDEYQEDIFTGLQEVYQEPDPNRPDEIPDLLDSDRGSDGIIEPNSIDVAPAKPDSNKLKDIIKYACLSTYNPDGNKKSSGKCARYTFNHANNFVRTLLKKEPQGKKNAAGGNANQEGYFKALEAIGYKRSDQGTVTKKSLINILSDKSKWNLGDVVCYWGVNAPTSHKNKGGVEYGHTQIFTDGYHGTSNKWTSDNEGNFGSSFVYNKYPVDNWRFLIFKSPTSTKDGQKKYNVA
jgi:hypothetical protein